MIDIDLMKISYETKVRETGGSGITTIPSPFMKGLNIEIGDKLVWTLEMDEKKKTLCITVKKKE